MPQISNALARTTPNYLGIPDVVIQDAVKRIAFHIPNFDLPKHETTVETLRRIDSDTVTFVISDDGNDLLVDIPPFNATATDMPSVLIQAPSHECAFFLSYAELETYKIAYPVQLSRPFIAFGMPQSLELIEELPEAMSAMLQHNERPVIR